MYTPRRLLTKLRDGAFHRAYQIAAAKLGFINDADGAQKRYAVGSAYHYASAVLRGAAHQPPSTRRLARH